MEYIIGKFRGCPKGKKKKEKGKKKRKKEKKITVIEKKYNIKVLED